MRYLAACRQLRQMGIRTVQTVALKKTPQAPRKDKPLRIPLPHSLYDHDGTEMCLIVKDRKGMRLLLIACSSDQH